MFGEMPERIQRKMSVYEANNSKCSDCVLDDIQKKDKQREKEDDLKAIALGGV
jgi:hypothetical protein